MVGGPSQEEYDKLKKKYDTQTQDLDNLQTEYYSYKNDMKKFDDLTDEEADALLAKVDEITAEKKAKEEEERKLPNKLPPNKLQNNKLLTLQVCHKEML